MTDAYMTLPVSEFEGLADRAQTGDHLLKALEPYLKFLEGKSATGWCMHDRYVSELPARDGYDALEEAVHQAIRARRRRHD
jgi:hypothetical protein